LLGRALFYLLRLRERLWVRPLLNCLLAVLAVFAARGADYVTLGLIPHIDPGTTEKLLTVLSSSMLAVATFAVGSMVSAYASASSSATPRAFALVLADDVSQNALSSFIAAFIYSVVGLIALKTGLYGTNGNFVLFVLTIAVFAGVVVTFVRWVDNIARLGRIGSTIDKAESATQTALKRRSAKPYLGGVPRKHTDDPSGTPVFGSGIGFIQHIDMGDLQDVATSLDTTIDLTVLPGTFLTPDRPLACVTCKYVQLINEHRARIADAVILGPERTFDGDPRFGLIVLSEIAGRALSPAVNDPGTAIAILGRLTRLFFEYCESLQDHPPKPEFDRVLVPGLRLADMCDDAFTAIARDGAGTVEVGLRLQKTFLALAATNDPEMKTQASRQSALALTRAEQALTLDADIDVLRDMAKQVAAACA